MARTGEGKKDPALNRSVERGGAGGSESGVWLAFFTLPSALHGDIGKRATSVGLRAPAGRFDAAKGGSIDTGGGRRAVSSSLGRGAWASGCCPQGFISPNDTQASYTEQSATNVLLRSTGT